MGYSSNFKWTDGYYHKSCYKILNILSDFQLESNYDVRGNENAHCLEEERLNLERKGMDYVDNDNNYEFN